MAPMPQSSRTIKCLFSLALFLTAFPAGVRPAGAQSCPQNRILLTLIQGVASSVVSSDATRDTTGGYAHGSYDLKNGLLSSSVSFFDFGSYVNDRWAGCFVDTEDEYWIVGLPPGTPVDFNAEFMVSGSWNVYPGVPQGEFSSEAFVAVAPDTSRYSIPIPGGCCHGTISRSLSLPLHRLGGERFHLRLHLGSQNYRGRVDESGQLQFTGLPPGVAVVSCQGFGGLSTPASHTSWGRLKTSYR